MMQPLCRAGQTAVWLFLVGLGLDGLDLAGLGVLDLAVLAGLQDHDLVGANLHAALPVAVLGLVGVVLEVTDDAQEGTLGDVLLLGPLAVGTDMDVEVGGFLNLGAVLLGVLAVGGDGEAEVSVLLIGGLIDAGDVTNDLRVVSVVFLLSHNCKVLIVNELNIKVFVFLYVERPSGLSGSLNRKMISIVPPEWKRRESALPMEHWKDFPKREMEFGFC